MSACSAARYFKIETLGAVDGPGLRFVLFLQGCPLRCPYCHNPEGWWEDGGQTITADAVIEQMRRYRAYYKNGGLTVSGGEPLMQADFVLHLFELCAREGVHTALDTSACVRTDAARRAVAAADLLLLDIKATAPVQHETIFGFPLQAALDTLALREAAAKPVWIRHVVAPGITDTEDSIRRLAKLIEPFGCVERVELLPFRKMCLEKYDQSGVPFAMRDAAEPSDEDMSHLSGLLSSLLPRVEMG